MSKNTLDMWLFDRYIQQIKIPKTALFLKKSLECIEVC